MVGETHEFHANGIGTREFERVGGCTNQFVEGAQISFVAVIGSLVGMKVIANMGFDIGIEVIEVLAFVEIVDKEVEVASVVEQVIVGPRVAVRAFE